MMVRNYVFETTHVLIIDQNVKTLFSFMYLLQIWKLFIYSDFVRNLMLITKQKVKTVTAIQFEKHPRSNVRPANAF